MIVGLLGILKAGGAYVPIDPTQPAGAAAFCMAESEAEVLLSRGGHPGFQARQECAARISD